MTNSDPPARSPSETSLRLTKDPSNQEIRVGCRADFNQDDLLVLHEGAPMTVTITPLTPVFAGEVGAIDLRQVHDRQSLEAIRAGMDKYAVLVFRDQDFSNEE